MDFGLSEEQRLLDATLRRLLEEKLPLARVRQVSAESEDGVDEAAWRALAELGVVGCLIPEKQGGSAGTLLDAVVVATALGHGCAPLPFLGSAVLAPILFDALGSPAQQDEWLPRLAAGRARVAVALSECVERRDDAGLRLEAGRLHGSARFVVDSAGADVFLAPAGAACFLLPASAPGLELRPMPTIDRSRRLSELTFDGVAADEPLAGDAAPGEVAAAIARALDAARVVLAADIVGSCDRALELSVAYALTREQFGRKIGSFQAVKHICAEMAAALEPARSLLWYAAHAFDALPAEAALSATLCKAHLSEVGRDLLRSATEVHGGIGFTDECDLQLWFKRVGLDRQLLGGPERLYAHAAELQHLSS